MKIFISYTRRHTYDQKVAEEIASELSDCGVVCFFDEHDIPIGGSIERTITEAFNGGYTHLVILASAALDQFTEWVEKELRLAVDRGLTIIPMVIAAPPGYIPKAVKDFRVLVAGKLGTEVATLFKHLDLEPPEPDLDPDFLPLLCDRRDEMDIFERNFGEWAQRLPGAVQTYCLTGDHNDKLDFFIERLRTTFLLRHATYLMAQQEGRRGGVRHIPLTWPTRWPRQKKVNALIEDVFNAVEYGYTYVPGSDRSPAGLAKLVAARVTESVLLLDLELPPRQWDSKNTLAILDDYRKFWRKVSTAGKQVVILLKIARDAKDPSVDAAKWDSITADVDAIEARSRRQRARAPLTRIAFTLVYPGDVTTWLDHFRDRGLAWDTNTFLTEAFATHVALSMQDIYSSFRRALDPKEKIA